jgi:flagellar operon protein
MDLKKIQTLDSLVPNQPAKSKDPLAGMGPSFKDTLTGQLDPAAAATPGSGATNPAAIGAKGLKSTEGVKFSNHAIERMQSRGINYSPDDIAKLNDAIGRAAAKGSKDSLILMKDSALIVSVKNNTVVTVMDKNALKENVFTNIDSTIVM